MNEQQYIELKQQLDNNVKLIISNMNELHNHEEMINKNAKRIEKNTGALEILHTINNVKKRFFIMWFLTFVTLIVSVGFNIFFLIKLFLLK